MNFNIKVYEKRLYDITGQEIIPDAQGLITINVEGKQRRFIYEKLINYLEMNGIIKKPKIKAIQRKKSLLGRVNNHRKRPVVVTSPDGKELNFTSSTEAAKELQLCRTNIPHVLSGKYRHINGYKFRYAVCKSNIASIINNKVWKV